MSNPWGLSAPAFRWLYSDTLAVVAIVRVVETSIARLIELAPPPPPAPPVRRGVRWVAEPAVAGSTAAEPVAPAAGVAAVGEAVAVGAADD